MVAIRKEKRSTSSSTYTTNTTHTNRSTVFTNVCWSLITCTYNPADYLYGWEKYPHGPAWSFGDRVPYAEAKNALGGHFGGGLYSPRDPILESKLGGVYIGNDLYTVGGVGGDGHW